MGGVRLINNNKNIISLGTKYHLHIPIMVSKTYHIIPITITNNISYPYRTNDRHDNRNPPRGLSAGLNATVPTHA
jgi:hypothetical protein